MADVLYEAARAAFMVGEFVAYDPKLHEGLGDVTEVGVDYLVWRAGELVPGVEFCAIITPNGAWVELIVVAAGVAHKELRPIV